MGGGWAGQALTCAASWGLWVSRVHMLLFSRFMSIFFAVFALLISILFTYRNAK